MKYFSHLTQICFDRRIDKCVRDSESEPFLGDSLQQFANNVENSLAEILPNFGPFKCLPSYLYEKPGIFENIQSIFRYFLLFIYLFLFTA